MNKIECQITGIKNVRFFSSDYLRNNVLVKCDQIEETERMTSVIMF